MPHGDRYRSYNELRASEIEGKDFRRTIRRIAGSRIAIIAPHGGAIESRTSEVADAIARGAHNLYLFEGIKPSGNYRSLHITSHNFDDPRCLELVSESDFVVAIHGYAGTDERVLIGGLDVELASLVEKQLVERGFRVQTTDHKFPGKDPTNICNRGRSGKGVQLELSASLRKDMNILKFAFAVRRALSHMGG